MNRTLKRVRDGYTYAGETDLKVMTCPDCGITYAIPERLQVNAYERGNREVVWFCPNGHELGYNGPNEEQRAKQAAERERNRAARLQRCLASLTGQLEAICDHMPEGPDGFALRAIIEGGLPEIQAIADRIAGGELDRAEHARSMDRGYQVTVLMRQEEETGQRDPEAWREDPATFMARYRKGRDDA